MDHVERRHLTKQAFTHALAGRPDEAAAAIKSITADSSAVQLFAVCCAFATAAAHALRRKLTARGATPNQPVYLTPGPDTAAANPARTFARRFIVAYTNRDHEMAKALFMAAHQAPGNQCEQSIAALLTEAADLHAGICKTHSR